MPIKCVFFTVLLLVAAVLFVRLIASLAADRFRCKKCGKWSVLNEFTGINFVHYKCSGCGYETKSPRPYDVGI